jgi:hypothetical protein
MLEQVKLQDEQGQEPKSKVHKVQSDEVNE